MADWKGVRKGEYEASSREGRRESSDVHRNLSSQSFTPASDSKLKHSAHMKREKRESSSFHFKRKHRKTSRSRSRSSSGDRKAKSRNRPPRSKELKKGKQGCSSSESSDNECTRRHTSRATRSEWSSERLKHKHRKRKRKYSSSSSDSSSDSSDIYSSESSVRVRRRKKHSKREKHSHRLHRKSEKKKHKLKSKRKTSSKMDSGRVVSSGIEGPHALPANPKQQDPSVVQSVVSISGKTVKMRGPMTKEEWEKQQSVVRRVYDPDTGRHRLVKGDGEIIEEIVSREQQKAINKQATLGDGLSFRAGLTKLL